jgi:hypothetical protein
MSRVCGSDTTDLSLRAAGKPPLRLGGLPTITVNPPSRLTRLENWEKQKAHITNGNGPIHFPPATLCHFAGVFLSRRNAKAEGSLALPSHGCSVTRCYAEVAQRPPLDQSCPYLRNVSSCRATINARPMRVEACRYAGAVTCHRI